MSGPLHVAVFGPTGGTGRAAVAQALAAGHRVTAFARRPEAIGVTGEQLVTVAGDAFDGEQVAAALAGCDAVITALGTRPWRYRPVCSAGTEHILAGMARHGVRRLICVSSLGVGDSRAHASAAWRLLMLAIRRELADKERMEQAVMASDRAWTIVRPALLTGGAATGRWRAATDGSIRGGRIRRADVAAFCVACLTGDEYVGQAPVLAG